MARRFLWLVLAAMAPMTAMVVAATAPATASATSPFTLHFQAAVDLSTVQVRTFLSGSFGGRGAGRLVASDPHDIVLDAASEGVPGTSLRVVIFRRGDQFVKLDIDLRARGPRDATIVLVPLAPIRVNGHVVPPRAGRSLEGATLQCTYLADWAMDFFGYIDGMPPSFEMGARTLSAKDNYAFSFELPDAVRDPSARIGSEFIFTAAPTIGDVLSLRHSSSDAIGSIRATAAYPADLLLAVRR